MATAVASALARPGTRKTRPLSVDQIGAAVAIGIADGIRARTMARETGSAIGKACPSLAGRTVSARVISE